MPVIDIIITAFCLFFAVIIHEIAHGFAALMCGDTTARDAGRLTLNPIRHIDPVGTVVLPAILALAGSKVMLGWAKPVPINIFRTRNPRRSLWLIAVAGPASNFLQAALALFLAFLTSFIFRKAGGISLFEYEGALYTSNPGFMFDAMFFICGKFFFSCFIVNLMLMAFNLIPVPPLDGSRVVTALLPPKAAEVYLGIERYGFIIIFALLYFNILDIILNPIMSGGMYLFYKIAFGI